MDPYNNYNYVGSINQPHTMISEQVNNWNNPLKSSRSIYINQNFQAPTISNKVLINPNFLNSKKVHVNPTYIKTSKAIFINPNVINTRQSTNTVQTQTSNINVPNNTSSDVFVSTKNKWVRKSPLKMINTVVQSTSMNPLKYTKFKIIRKDTIKRRRRTSVNLRYKLIRSNSNKSKSPEKRHLNNKFKLDRRNSTERTKSKLYFINKAYRLKIDHRNAILKRNNWMTYNKSVKRGNLARMSKILNISGQKYKMDNNKMVLKLAMTSDVHRTVKVRVKIPLRRKLKTNNIPCPTFHRFGICQRHNRGMCQKVHNVNQIAVCSKFLQGTCHNDSCPLSHKISPSKMATCKFYLEGLCTKDGCPYLHVKVNAKVAICKDFLTGFCQLGKECNNRHEFLCPNFEQNGRCVKRNCQFPHRNVRRPSAGRLKERNHVKTVTDSSDATATSSNKRYYQKEDDGNVKSESVSSLSGLVQISSNDDIERTTPTVVTFKRPQLGTLPTFIPF